MNGVSPDVRQAHRRVVRTAVHKRIAGAGAALIVGLALAAAMRPAQTLTGTAPLAQKPTPTLKVCHMCDDEVAPAATPTVCYECDAVHPVRLTAMAASPTTTPESHAPIVHLAMFWMRGCPACEEVIQDVLPTLKAEHGSRLEVLLIEVATQQEVDQLFALAADIGILKEQTGVPFLIIGDRVIVGTTHIGRELPGLIDAYLAQSGVELLDHAILASALTRAVPFDPGLATSVSQAPSRPEGFALAILVLVAMVTALMYSIASILFPRLPIPVGRWVAQAVPWLAVLGLMVAGYLAYVETQAVAAVCGPVGDCNVVQTSPYARLFGVLPVGVLGLLTYLFFLAAWVVERRAAGRLAIWARLGSSLIPLVGTAFSIYLTFLEIYVIRAVCLWCLTSAVAMTLLLLLSLKTPRAWRLEPARVRK